MATAEMTAAMATAEHAGVVMQTEVKVKLEVKLEDSGATERHP
eukprot:gene4232-10180_t